MGKNSTLTPEEIEIHKRAVKLRKMTDAKLVEAFDEAKAAETPSKGSINELLIGLENGECKGVKGGIAYRIRNYAVEKGLV